MAHALRQWCVFVRLIALVSLLTLWSGIGRGQDVGNATNTGYPENAVFHGTDVDSVQVTNGDLHIQIPIWSAKGRGLDTAGSYVYDSKEWFFNNHCYSSGICVDRVSAEPNNNMVLTARGPLDYAVSYKGVSCISGGSTYAETTNIVLREPDGTKHHFIPDPAFPTKPPCPDSTTATTILYADDGSGWMMHLDPTSGEPSNFFRKDGTQFGPSSAFTAPLTDSNGNQLVGASGTTGTDTVGRTFYDDVSATYTGSAAKYIDSTGTQQSASVTSTTTVPVATQLCGFSEADQCAETTSGTWTVPMTISFPGEAQYSFTYEQNGGAEIASITLPSGAQISYTYGAWQVGGRPVASRTVTSSGVTGTWIYTINGTYTTMTDPYGNDTVFDCSAASDNSYPYISPCYPGTTKYYSGSQTSGTLLKTETTDYTGFALGSGINNLIKLPTRLTTTWNQINRVEKTETDWDTASVTGGTTAWRNPLEVREYDFGSGSPGALVRKTHYNYKHLQDASYLAVNIADRVTSKIVYDGGGNLKSQFTAVIDGVGVAPTANVPGHDYTNFSSSNNTRGNVTSISVWRDTDGAWLTTAYKYDDLGNRLSATDPWNHTTTFSYSDKPAGACSPSQNTYAYLTQTTDPLGYRTQHSYYYCNGLLQSTSDENQIRANQPGLQVNSYDPLSRPLSIAYADGGSTGYQYGDSAPNTITKTVAINAGTSKTTRIELDGLGRERKTTLTTDPAGATYTRISYDAALRPYQAWNPTRCDPDAFTSCSGETTFGYTQYQYDALQRKIIQTQPDGHAIQWCYNGVAAPGQGSNNCFPNKGTEAAPVNLGQYTWTDITDETGRHWQQIADGVGRLAAVLEPNASNVPALETDYRYSALDNLVQVDQWGGAYNSSGERLRTFSYDSLSRLLTASNPESGSLTYSYVTSGALCAGDPSLPCSKTDARGVTTSYKYDWLNRLTSKTFLNDSTGKPSACFQYDIAASGIGKLGNQWTQAGACSASPPTTGVLTRRAILAYDPMGRVANEQQCVFSNCASNLMPFSLPYTYDLSGNLSTYQPGVAISGATITFTHIYDGADRLQNITSTWTESTHPGTLFSEQSGSSSGCGPASSYSAFGGLQNALLGTGLTLTRSYDNRLRPNCEIDKGGMLASPTPGAATITITGAEQSQ